MSSYLLRILRTGATAPAHRPAGPSGLPPSANRTPPSVGRVAQPRGGQRDGSAYEGDGDAGRVRAHEGVGLSAAGPSGAVAPRRVAHEDPARLLPQTSAPVSRAMLADATAATGGEIRAPVRSDGVFAVAAPRPSEAPRSAAARPSAEPTRAGDEANVRRPCPDELPQRAGAEASTGFMSAAEPVARHPIWSPSKPDDDAADHAPPARSADNPLLPPALPAVGDGDSRERPAPIAAPFPATMSLTRPERADGSARHSAQGRPPRIIQPRLDRPAPGDGHRDAPGERPRTPAGSPPPPSAPPSADTVALGARLAHVQAPLSSGVTTLTINRLDVQFINEAPIPSLQPEARAEAPRSAPARDVLDRHHLGRVYLSL